MVVSADRPEVGDAVTTEQLYTLPHAVYEDVGLRTHGELALASAGRSVRATVVGNDFMTIFHLIPSTRLIALRMAGATAARRRTRGIALTTAPPAPCRRMIEQSAREPERSRHRSVRRSGPSARGPAVAVVAA
jgi:hypothetical protein